MRGRKFWVIISSCRELNTPLFQYGCEVHWHSSLRSVPKAFSLFIAHEFFDALPINKFVKSKEGWREVLIDVDTESKVSSRDEDPISGSGYGSGAPDL